MKAHRLILPALLCSAAVAQQPFTVLKPDTFAHYDTQFAADEKDATGNVAPDEWPWMAANIPMFESSDKSFEEMYYFRWYAWRKHLIETPYGFLITEWLPKPESPGYMGTLNDAAGFHLGEARWLRNPKIAEDYARYWFTADAKPRNYSWAAATSVRSVTLANGDVKLEQDLLPGMVKNYEGWEATNLDPSVGMFWQIDTRDAMEKSIQGDGYRPVLNPYLVSDAAVIASIAKATGDAATAETYAKKSELLHKLVDDKLWNTKDQFYEVMSPSADSGIRKQKKFIDPGTVLKLSGTREEIGYIPWAYYLPAVDRAVAWKQLFDPKGFAGKYGPTTSERRSPRFRFESSDQCTWNGPMWPFATTQTLEALANLLHGPAQSFIGKKEYYQLFANYVLAQHLKLADGRTIDWIDEDLDADTDEWIAKGMLKAKNKQVGRGNYYNHSGFADPLITGMIGLEPRADDVVKIAPLLPAGMWTYFALDGLPYHGHTLAIVFDADGKHYKMGAGLMVFIDGKKAASRATLGELQTKLPGVAK